MNNAEVSHGLRVIVISVEEQSVEWFLDDVGAMRDDHGGGSVSISGTPLQFIPLREGDRVDAGMADLVIGLVRHVDLVSLQKLETQFKSIPSGLMLPSGFFLYRKTGEQDFKMSCPYCGQKLWVRDTDKDKRGRCPNCKKGFTLPQQEAHLAQSLSLRSTVPVRKIIQGDAASLGGPLQALLRIQEAAGSIHPPMQGSNAAAAQTMNVKIDAGPLQGYQ